MPKIALEIKDCSECPFARATTCYTADSFEHEEDYHCYKLNRKIARCIGPFDKMPPIPDDCPILAK